jgi:hypothetical protein
MSRLSFEPSFAAAMNRVPSSPSAWIAWSICITETLAPPWSGPERAQMPAEIDVKRLEALEPTVRTVEVEQFCSWSTCRRRSRFSARATSGTAT